MAVSDEVRKRFAEYVKVQALGSRYIDRRTEKKILEDGVLRFEIGLDDGRHIMNTIAAEEGYVFETDCERRIKDILDGLAEDGKLGPREFTYAVAIFRKSIGAPLTDDEARMKVKQVMQTKGFRPKRTNFLFGRKWFDKIVMVDV
jgi:hypothetical protein